MLDFLADCVINLDQKTDERATTRRLRVVKYRGSDFLSNEHPYVIASTGIVLMPVAVSALGQAPLGERVSAGLPQLDAMLGGGYRRASSILIAGSSGTGKTTTVATFATAACKRQERVLFISFEESQEAVVSALKDASIDLQTPLDEGYLKIFTALPEALGVEQHLLRIYQTIGAFEPDHVAVDAISACSRMGSEQAAFDFLVRLLTRCKKDNITFLCTNQISPSVGPEGLSGFSNASLMDVLVLLEQIHEPAFLRRLTLVKVRGSHHSHAYHPFTITDQGIRFPVNDQDQQAPAADRRAGAAPAPEKGARRD